MAKKNKKTEAPVENTPASTEETPVDTSKTHPLIPGAIYETTLTIDVEQPEGSAENWRKIEQGTRIQLMSHDPDPNGHRNNCLFMVPELGMQRLPSDLLPEYADLVSLPDED